MVAIDSFGRGVCPELLHKRRLRDGSIKPGRHLASRFEGPYPSFLDANFPAGAGEQTANLLSFGAVATKACTISFTGPSGVRHSVEVSAESLYEAAVLGLNLLKQDGWVDPVAPGTQLEIQVKHPATTHCVSVAQLRRWVDGIAISPDETLKKRKLKVLLSP